MFKFARACVPVCVRVCVYVCVYVCVCVRVRVHVLCQAISGNALAATVRWP